MCGIAGIIWKDIEKPQDQSPIGRMIDIMAYRGPDDRGLYCDGPVGLAHRRLSIIDLSHAGHQPMASHDGKFVIVFNGEIYNYLELREELQRSGCSFNTQSDTEVILEAYRLWDYDCVEHFNGMWAFALYDKSRETVFFSRDRFGIKPLYYVDRKDCFAFASEIKAILEVFPDERKANLAIIHSFLPSGSFDEGPETFFKNIVSLQHGHNAAYDVRRNHFHSWLYYKPDLDALRERWLQEDPVEALWHLLQSSLKLHMRSDVPVGTCLSGGIDSSTIVSLMSTMRTEPVYTFSGLYEDKDCNEREYVDLVNKHTGAIACPVFPEPGGDLIDMIATITWHQDEPMAGPGLITQFFVMKRAAESVKVILDGQGGDELFAGYLSYFEPHVEDLFKSKKLINWLKAVHLLFEIQRYWGREWVSPIIKKLFAERFRRRIKGFIAGDVPPLFHPSLLERCSGNEIVRTREKRLPTILGNTLYWHLMEQSIPGLLHFEDRNSMAFSIEARVPLLDYRIVEFAMGLDSVYKIKGSWTKWVLRKCASRILPKEVAWRRSKMGYPTPSARWLRQSRDKDHISGLLFSRSFLERELVTKDAVQFYWDQHQAGRADYSWLLLRLVALELWHRHFIDAFLPAPSQGLKQFPLKETVRE
ncbi:MAG: asparagine synthase (glutamine-hydrolyzing) [Vulcanimicrobiota bacterium]